MAKKAASASRRTTKPAAGKGKVTKPDQDTIDKVILLMTSGLRDNQLRATACQHIKRSEAIIDAAITEARKRLTLAAEYNRNEELALSIQQWRNLFQLAIAQNSLPDASAARNRLDTLLGLKQAPPTEPPGPTGDSPEAQAIQKHLLPFALTDESQPLVEHVRLAALKLSEKV